MSKRETAWICRPSSCTRLPACTLRIAGSVSDGANDGGSIATGPRSDCGRSRSRAPTGPGAAASPRVRSAPLRWRSGQPETRRAHGHLDARGPTDPQHEVVRDDGEPERLRLSSGDGADRQLQAPGRDVANDERTGGVPVRALPEPEPEGRRLRGNLTDGGGAEPERPGTDRGRGRTARAARIQPAGCRARARPAQAASGRGAQRPRRPSRRHRSCR